MNIRCQMSPCLYPIDSHICNMTLFAISNNASDVILVSNNTRDRNAGEDGNGLWHVSVGATTARLIPNTMFNGKGTASIINSSIKLTRKSRYFWVTVLFPLLLIVVVTFAAPLFPLHTGDRTSLLITSFLASIVFLDIVFKNVPKTSDQLPIIVIFILALLAYTAFQIIITAFISFFDDYQSSSDTGLIRKVTTYVFQKLSCRKKERSRRRCSLNESGKESEDVSTSNDNFYKTNAACLNNALSRSEYELRPRFVAESNRMGVEEGSINGERMLQNDGFETDSKKIESERMKNSKMKSALEFFLFLSSILMLLATASTLVTLRGSKSKIRCN